MDKLKLEKRVSSRWSVAVRIELSLKRINYDFILCSLGGDDLL